MTGTRKNGSGRMFPATCRTAGRADYPRTDPVIRTCLTFRLGALNGPFRGSDAAHGLK
jgi:hypothetical protein